MDICDENVTDIPIDSDINLEIPLFPVGLTISENNNLKNLSSVEKPTKPPSPRLNNDATSQPLKNSNHANSLIKLVSARERDGKFLSRNSKQMSMPPREKPLFETRTKNKLSSSRELKIPSQLKSSFGKKVTSKDEKSLRSPQGRRTQISPVNTPRTPELNAISPIPNGITVIKEEEGDTPFNDTISIPDIDKSDPIPILSTIDIKIEEVKENGVDNQVQSNVENVCYRSINDLKAARYNINKCMERINDQLNNMKEHKTILSFISSQMKESSHAALELKRNNQGVPFVNAVKELVKRVHEKFNNDINKKRFTKITADDVPFVVHINEIIKIFGKICQRISLTTVNYNVTFLEDFHLMAGKLHAMIEFVLILYYQDATDDQCSYEKTEEPVPTENGFNDDASAIFDLLYCSVLNLVSTQNLTDFNHAKRNSLKLLEKLGKVLSRSNESLGNIARLSLGNPKNQSLFDSFASVTIILKESDDILKELTELKTPCVSMLRDNILKATQISEITKPGERQVEELKFALGVCDGSLSILAKHISTNLNQ